MKLFSFLWIFLSLSSPVLNSMNHIKNAPRDVNFDECLNGVPFVQKCFFPIIITKQLCVAVCVFFVFVRKYDCVSVCISIALSLFLSVSLCEKSHNWVREFFNISICFALILFNLNWNFKHSQTKNYHHHHFSAFVRLRFVLLALSALIIIG